MRVHISDLDIEHAQIFESDQTHSTELKLADNPSFEANGAGGDFKEPSSFEDILPQESQATDAHSDLSTSSPEYRQSFSVLGSSSGNDSRRGDVRLAEPTLGPWKDASATAERVLEHAPTKVSSPFYDDLGLLKIAN